MLFFNRFISFKIVPSIQPLKIVNMEETKVVIVGAGPTGLALAAFLGMMNVEVKYSASFE